jgi:hypothetical protein
METTNVRLMRCLSSYFGGYRSVDTKIVHRKTYKNPERATRQLSSIGRLLPESRTIELMAQR